MNHKMVKKLGIIKAAVKNNSCMFQCATNEMKDNWEIVIASIKIGMRTDQIGSTSNFKKIEKQSRNYYGCCDNLW